MVLGRLNYYHLVIYLNNLITNLTRLSKREAFLGLFQCPGYDTIF